ncbi:MAG: type IV pilin N-terminal domain-containing protein [Candidatus Hadarchaeales archaeon]
MKDFKGVSAVVATILLIAITVVAIGSIAIFVSGLGGTLTSGTITANITIENAVNTSRGIIIKHMGGDTISNAFSGSTLNTSVLEVRISSSTVTSTPAYTLNGGSINVTQFKAGDILKAAFIGTQALSSGDVITIVYKPANQILTQETVA